MYVPFAFANLKFSFTFEIQLPFSTEQLCHISDRNHHFTFLHFTFTFSLQCTVEKSSSCVQVCQVENTKRRKVNQLCTSRQFENTQRRKVNELCTSHLFENAQWRKAAVYVLAARIMPLPHFTYFHFFFSLHFTGEKSSSCVLVEKTQRRKAAVY